MWSLLRFPFLAFTFASCLAVGGDRAFAAGTPADPTLRSVYADDFLIGVALGTAMVDGRNGRAGEIAARQFSSLTAENDMKWQSVNPQPGQYDFSAADAYIAFAEKHQMSLIGHTLVWHSQTPRWVFQDTDGGTASRELLLARMREHIHTVAGRYQGRIKGWDVVNEAISDGGSRAPVLRDSPWKRIIGEDFIDHAFRFAREADPKAELYYNDYGLFHREKRERTVRMLRGLLERGVPIDGVGMQGHYQLDHPSIEDVEQTIKDFAALGLKVMVTELDVDVLPSRGAVGVADIARREDYEASLNPHQDGLPEEMQQRLARRYAELFALFIKHRQHITRVTLWGLHDGQTWLNHFPIRGRTNHPLLIDRELQPKPAFFSVLKAGQ
jgi:endo-1,4-beta-xylanase